MEEGGGEGRIERPLSLVGGGERKGGRENREAIVTGGWRGEEGRGENREAIVTGGWREGEEERGE